MPLVADSLPSPPRAPRRPTELPAHGETRVEDYFWLRERDAPDVLAYLEAENAYTAAVTAADAARRDELFTELRGHVQETDVSAPVPDGPWEYYTRTVEGMQYSIHCRRRRGAGDAAEMVLLDGNVLAGDSPYFRIGDAETSPDQQRLAYSVDFNGSERYELRVRDLATGDDIDAVANVYYGVAWGDDETLFYTRPDDAMRPYQVWRHTVGTPADGDVVVWQDDDERFDVWVHRSRSDAFVLFGAESRTTSEVWLVPTSDPR